MLQGVRHGNFPVAGVVGFYPRGVDDIRRGASERVDDGGDADGEFSIYHLLCGDDPYLELGLKAHEVGKPARDGVADYVDRWTPTLDTQVGDEDGTVEHFFAGFHVNQRQPVIHPLDVIPAQVGGHSRYRHPEHPSDYPCDKVW